MRGKREGTSLEGRGDRQGCMWVRVVVRGQGKGRSGGEGEADRWTYRYQSPIPFVWSLEITMDTMPTRGREGKVIRPRKAQVYCVHTHHPVGHVNVFLTFLFYLNHWFMCQLTSHSGHSDSSPSRPTGGMELQLIDSLCILLNIKLPSSYCECLLCHN